MKKQLAILFLCTLGVCMSSVALDTGPPDIVKIEYAQADATSVADGKIILNKVGVELYKITFIAGELDDDVIQDLQTDAEVFEARLLNSSGYSMAHWRQESIKDTKQKQITPANPEQRLPDRQIRNKLSAPQ